MGWFNYYGLVIIAIIMIPNIIYAIKNKGVSTNSYSNKILEIAEQVGRYACMIFMVFNVPHTYLNFWFYGANVIYLSFNSVLCLTYLVFWIICWKQSGLLKAVSLSALPTAIFLFSGIMLASIPLLVFAVLFGVAHIFISIKSIKIK